MEKVLETSSVKFSTRQAADYLKVSKHTLAIWRLKGFGPQFHKFGSRVLYDKGDIDAWLAEKTFQSTTQYPCGPSYSR